MTLHTLIGLSILTLTLAILIGGFIYDKMVMHPEKDWF